MLSASFAASGSLAPRFAAYFNEVWGLPPALLLTIGFIVVLAIARSSRSPILR